MGRDRYAAVFGDHMIEIELADNGVMEIIIDNPPVNAFGIDLLAQLAAEIRNVNSQSGVRAVLLRSLGRGFCAGGDLKEVERLNGFEGILGQASGSLAASLAVLECPVPVICALHRYCIGVGMIIAASADILIAAKETRFVLAEVDNGAVTGAVQALRLMPEMRLRAAMMTAAPVFAEELHSLGTLFKIVQELDLVASARDVAASVAAKPAETMRRLKTSLNASTRVEEIRTLYRAELSYTYELNMTVRRATTERRPCSVGRRTIPNQPNFSQGHS